MSSERPLTERERAAVLKDLAEYRVLLAASYREAKWFAGLACWACRRNLQATKQIYAEIFGDIRAETETRIAGIRALEHDLTEGGQP